MVDGIALVVEGEAITTAEIRAIRTQMGISKKKATDLLIQDRLQKSVMREIKIDETLVDQKVSAIAKQNNLSIPKMQKILKRQGTKWTHYRSSIRDALKQEKFYKETVIASIPTPSDDELKILYRNHKSSFTMPSYINVVEYSSKTQSGINDFLRTKKRKGIKSRSSKKSTKTLDPDMLSTFLRTNNGKYTTSFNAGDKYIAYKVVSKRGKTPLSFAASRNAVEARWRQEQQGKALEDYFEKLKTRADIEILR
jgi:parvulin-like peptidyl-prolyl isomerase